MRDSRLFRWLQRLFTRIQAVPDQTYCELLDSLPEMVCLLDPQGRLTSVNRAAETITGYSSAELLRMNISCFVPPEFLGQLLHVLPVSIEQEHETVSCEIQAVVREGKLVPLEIKRIPIWTADKLIGIQIIGRDLFQQRHLELALQKACETKEQAQAAKNTFLANMNHQLRTPINGVLGITELALDTDLTPEQREYLLMIKFSADSLLETVNDILDFSKLQSEKIELQRTIFNLHDSVAQAANALALHSDEKDLELTYYIAPEVPEKVVGDPSKLRQVLVQLLGNAIKFTERGEVSLSVCLDDQPAGPDKVRLKFSVADTGIGISPKKRNDIFEAFSRSVHDTAGPSGNGLGLAISSRIVEAMGGPIWMDSKIGVGSSFHFALTFETCQIIQPATTSVEGLSQAQVLVVDDNSSSRRILAETLRAWGMEPWEADSGTAALSVMEQAHESGKRIRMALVDAHMPGMDGFELVSHLRQNVNFGGAIVMLLTPLRQRGDAERCRELGLPRYVLKPVHKPELLKAILTALGQEQDLSAARNTARLVARASLGHLRILVAEDNLASQFLMVRMLGKMGQEVVVANNGKEALEKLAGASFDLIFMDVQMPEMDGYTTTAKIREQEKKNGDHIPIVAMTAHAMKGDRERCIAAGMDGYIAKPVSAQAVESILLAFSNPDALSQGKPPHDWDRVKALERAGGDHKLLCDLVGIYFKEKPKLLSQLVQALAEHNPLQLERGAHNLKGVLGFLSASSMCEIARQLEELGKKHDMAKAEGLVTTLQYQLSEMDSALGKVLEAAQ